MRLPTLALSALIALLGSSLARAQTNGFPQLPPVPHTGQLPENTTTTQFTFVVAGDNRPNGKTSIQPKILGQIFNDAQQYKPAFFLWCGDTISGHTTDEKTLKEQYAKFITAAKQAGAPLFNAPGNHEMDLVMSTPGIAIEVPVPKMNEYYLKYMRDPANTPPYAYGAFNYGNSRFIALNTEEVAPGDLTRSPGRTVKSLIKLDPGYVSQEQVALLTQDLENNKSKDHIFIFMHHPIVPNKYDAGLTALLALELQQLFAKYPNVSYVLAAHEHLYYNASANTLTPSPWKSGTSQPPIYLITGGAGAPLDKCGKNTGYCHSFNHYLVFTVNGDTVKVDVVQPPTTSTKQPRRKND